MQRTDDQSNGITVSSAPPAIRIDDEHNDNYHQLRFGGVGRLYSETSQLSSGNSQESDVSSNTADAEAGVILERLRNAVVVVVGLGGVG